ncbi:MDR family MFS transporter [Falsirhodobacter deserti]|uniref:MDR family MFS transporter n=1 Tax=Falsirhodobacter deserti TaxID=1365611 RepID=UPI000FE3F026|nr:MDR family MFS transporter [Falsirhodobacter deserti]
MSSAASADVAYGMGLTPARRRAIFAFLMLSMFMATLDNQIVSTALPTIVAEFGAMDRFSWIGSAYLLATSAVMPIYGKLGDLFGRKYVIMAAVSLFTLGSLASGLAGSMNQLIAARVFQGLGGGGIMVSIFAINSDLFEPRERAKYQSFSSLVLMASGSIGPTIGGILSTTLGWRSIFLVNVPIAAIALTGLYLMLPLTRPGRRPKIDWAGALLLALAIAATVLWADSAQIFRSMLSPPALVLPAVAILAVCLWIRIERRAPEPIMPLGLFRDPVFPLLLIVSLTSGGIAIGMVNFHALFLQMTTGLSPAHAGLFFIAVTGGIAAGSLTAGRIIARTGRYKPLLVTGLCLSVATLFLLSRMGPDTPLAAIAGVLLVQGLAIGLGQQAPIIGVQFSAPRRDVGAATGAVTLMRMGGAALAISVYGAILSSLLDPARVAQDNAAAYAEAFTGVYLGAMVIAMIGLVAALLLRPALIPAAQPARAPVER